MNKFIEIAYQQALKSSLEVRVGAILVMRNKVISKGYNKHKNFCTSTSNRKCIL